MKKLVQIIEMKLMKTSPTEDGLQLSFVDYKPETEHVDPRVDKFKQLIKEHKGALPKDTAEVLEGLMDMGSEMGMGTMPMGVSYFPNAWFYVSKAQYEELGKPLVGDLLLVDITRSEGPS